MKNLETVDGSTALEIIFIENNIRSGADLRQAIEENPDIADEIFEIPTSVYQFAPGYIESERKKHANYEYGTPRNAGDDGFDD